MSSQTAASTNPLQSCVDEMELARRIHRSFLPRPSSNARSHIALRCQEMDELGGDYATAVWRRPDSLFLSICDVTGHGLAAALLAARINTFVHARMENSHHPCQVIEELNTFLCEHFQGLGVYATFFCAEIDWQSRTIHYAGAGHPPALLRKGDGSILALESGSPMLGILDTFPQACRVDGTGFDIGDFLLLYTDGITEARNEAGDFFEMEHLRRSLKTGPTDRKDGADEMVDHLLSEVQNFSGKRGTDDDILAMGVFIRE